MSTRSAALLWVQYSESQTVRCVLRSQCQDDYLSRDPSTSKRAAYIRRTMAKARDWAER